MQVVSVLVFNARTVMGLPLTGVRWHPMVVQVQWAWLGWRGHLSLSRGDVARYMYMCCHVRVMFRGCGRACTAMQGLHAGF